MKNKRFVLSLVAAASVWGAMAQSEWGSYTSAEISKKISKKWSLDGSLELRTGNDFQNVDSWRLGVGATYKLNKWLKADAGYTFIYDYNARDTTYNAKGKANKVNYTYFSPRHRVFASISANKTFGKWSLGLRERWQYTWRPEQQNVRMDLQDDEDDPGYGYTYSRKGSAKHVWRNRIELGYKINKIWEPYMSGESYMAKGWDKLKFRLGTDISLSKRHSLDVGYLYQRSFNDEDADKHIINVGYKYKF